FRTKVASLYWNKGYFIRCSRGIRRAVECIERNRPSHTVGLLASGLGFGRGGTLASPTDTGPHQPDGESDARRLLGAAPSGHRPLRGCPGIQSVRQRLPRPTRQTSIRWASGTHTEKKFI